MSMLLGVVQRFITNIGFIHLLLLVQAQQIRQMLVIWVIPPSVTPDRALSQSPTTIQELTQLNLLSRIIHVQMIR